jgi:hypothetical protein
VNTLFDDVWLSRYPIPEYICFDKGGEYKKIFKELVNNYGIKKKNSTPFNPQYNGIIERDHLMINDALWATEIDGRELDDKDPWGPFLSSAAMNTFDDVWLSRYPRPEYIYGLIKEENTKKCSKN